MKKSIFLTLILILIILIFTNCGKIQYPYFWKAEVNDSTIYFFGSRTLLSLDNVSALFPLSKKIYKAFEESDKLFFDVDISVFQKPDANLVQKQFELPADDSLLNYMSDEEIDNILKYWKKMGIHMPKRELIKLRPWYINAGFKTNLYFSMGFDPKHGIDQHFLKRVTNQDKIVFLNTPFEKSEFFNKFPHQVFVDNINYETTLDIDEEKKKIATLENFYLEGRYEDVKQYSYERGSDTQTKILTIFYQYCGVNNKKWVKKILDIIEPGKKYFVVVGVYHFFNKNNIFEQLESSGAEVNFK